MIVGPMRYYAIGEIEVTDSSWVREYIEQVTGMVERRGGRYLARTPRVERVEGEAPLPQTFLIIEWPSKEAADEFYASQEYRAHRERRRGGARNEFRLVAGEDFAGVARIGD
jgi:uncharacterized protein (DUF1330 family)